MTVVQWGYYFGTFEIKKGTGITQISETRQCLNNKVRDLVSL